MIDGDRQRGFALLVVLTTAALLALIGTRLTATGRTEAQIARNLVAAATAEAAADGGLEEAIFHLLAPSEQAWAPDGRIHRIAVGAAIVDIRIDSEAGKLNPNTAPIALMAALLRRLGQPPDAATQLAGAIFDWHTPGALSVLGGDKAAAYRAAGRTDAPPGRPMETLGELQAVLGMTPQILAALRPVLSVHNELGLDIRYVAPVLRAALADAGIGFDVAASGRIAATITAVSQIPTGGRAARRAVVQLSEDSAHPWRVLTWEAPGGL